MKIVTVPNKILTTPTKPVEKFNEDLKKLVAQMEEVLKNQRNPEGVGLSANQIGVDLRVAVVRLNSEDKAPPNLLAIVNPKITKSSKEMSEGYEGCLSIPKKYAPLKRAQAVTIEGQDLQGNPLKLHAQGFLARIFQHEIDHLNGKLITDRAKGKTLSAEELH